MEGTSNSSNWESHSFEEDAPTSTLGTTRSDSVNPSPMVDMTAANKYVQSINKAYTTIKLKMKEVWEANSGREKNNDAQFPLIVFITAENSLALELLKEELDPGDYKVHTKCDLCCNLLLIPRSS